MGLAHDGNNSNTRGRSHWLSLQLWKKVLFVLIGDGGDNVGESWLGLELVLLRHSADEAIEIDVLVVLEGGYELERDIGAALEKALLLGSQVLLALRSFLLSHDEYMRWGMIYSKIKRYRSQIKRKLQKIFF